MAERYPTVRAGQKVTGSLLDSMLPKTVRKTADTGRTSTTTSADPELQFTVEANAVYVVRGALFVDSTNATTDINVDWSAPTGADGTWAGLGQPTTATTTDGDVRTVAELGITSARAFGAITAGGSGTLTILINTMLIVGSTAGTYSLDWAANSASGTVTVKADSFLTFWRIA